MAKSENIALLISPLSVNKAWQGRRFKSKYYKKYCEDVKELIPRNVKRFTGDVDIEYLFYLKYYKTTDADNLIKPLQDILVSAGVIEDDRKIIKYYIEKFPAKQSSIIVKIRKHKE